MSRARSTVLHSISRVNPADGDICHFSDGLTGAPNKIIAASDGKLYFTISDDPAAIGRIKTDGTIKEFRTGLTNDAYPVALAEGGDRDLWFTGSASPGRIGRMENPSHAFTEFAGGTPGLGLLADADPAGITRGPDGNVWFTESGLDGRIARLFAPPVAELALEPEGAADRPPHGHRRRAATRRSRRTRRQTSLTVEYGPDTSYGKQSDPVDVDGSSGAGPVTETIPLSLPAELPLPSPASSRPTTAAPTSPLDRRAVDRRGRPPARLRRPRSRRRRSPTPTPTPDKTQGNSAQAHTNGHGNDDVVHAADVPVAPPVLGKSVVVKPAGGSVKVKTPGSKRYRALAAGAQLPVGTTVDTRSGKIVLQSARDAHGRTQKGTFWGGVFQIRQRKHGKGMTDLHLRGGGFSRCGNRAGISVLAREAKGKRRVVRRLWGKDKHSRFRTHGRDSVATVRGTRWVTTDRCDGTLTRVTQGKVSVRDLHRKRSVLVSAGHAYLARHRHHHR